MPFPAPRLPHFLTNGKLHSYFILGVGQVGIGELCDRMLYTQPHHPLRLALRPQRILHVGIRA